MNSLSQPKLSKKCSHCKTTKDLHIISRRVHKDGSKHISYMCRKCTTDRLKKYRKTKHGKEVVYRNVYKSMKNNKEKVNVRSKLNMAVREGKISKPLRCLICVKEKKLEAHHPDYRHPFIVIWLCRQCHADLHRQLKNT